MLHSIMEYQFLQNALMAGFLASIVCGMIGVIIIEKKLIMMSGGIAHTSYGGVGFGYLVNIEPILGAFFFAAAAALGIGFIKRKGSARFDAVVALFWSLGMALGIVFIALMPGYPPDLSSYLFGNILSVTKGDLMIMAVLTLLIMVMIIIFYHVWKAFLFDEEFACIIGVRTVVLEYLLLLLIAMTVVILIRVVGIILALSLLTVPAATAILVSSNLKSRMLYSILFGNVYCITGLWISYVTNIASGAAIVITSSGIYLGLYALHILTQKKTFFFFCKNSIEKKEANHG